MYCVCSGRSACVVQVVSVVYSVAVLYVVYYLCHHIYYKMLHTFGELSDMHFCYDAADGNSTKAQRLYGKKYNGRHFTK